MPYIRPEGECGRCKMVFVLAWTLLALRSASSASLPMPPTLASVEMMNSPHIPEIQERDSFKELVPHLEEKELSQGHDIEIKGRVGEAPKETQRINKRFINKKNEGRHNLENLTHATKHKENKIHDSDIIYVHDLENAEKFGKNGNNIRREIIDGNGFHRNDEDKLNSIKILDIGDVIERHHKTELVKLDTSLEDDVSKDIELAFKQKEIFDTVSEKQIHEDTSDISTHHGKHDFIINHDNKNNFIDIKERHKSRQNSNKIYNHSLHEPEGHHINSKNQIVKSGNEEKEQIFHNHNKGKKNQDDVSDKINSANNNINHDLKKSESNDNCDDLKEKIKDIEDIINDDDEDISDIILDDDSKMLKLDSILKENKHVKVQQNHKSEEIEFNDNVSQGTKFLEDLEEIKTSAFEDDIQLLKFDDQEIKEISDLIAKHHINSKEIPIIESQEQTDIDNVRNTQENEDEIDKLSQPINSGLEEIKSKHFDLHSPTFHKNHHHHPILESSHEISKRNGDDENCKGKVGKTFNLSFIFKK